LISRCLCSLSKRKSFIETHFGEGLDLEQDNIKKIGFGSYIISSNILWLLALAAAPITREKPDRTAGFVFRVKHNFTSHKYKQPLLQQCSGKHILRLHVTKDPFPVCISLFSSNYNLLDCS